MVRWVRLVLVGLLLAGCSSGSESTTTTSASPSSTVATTSAGDGFCGAVQAADDVAFDLTVSVEMMILGVSQVVGEDLPEELKEKLVEEADRMDDLAVSLDEAYVVLAELESEVTGDIDLVRPWVATLYRILAEGVRAAGTVDEFNGLIDSLWSENPPAELAEVRQIGVPGYGRLADYTLERCGSVIDGE